MEPPDEITGIEAEEHPRIPHPEGPILGTLFVRLTIRQAWTAPNTDNVPRVPTLDQINAIIVGALERWAGQTNGDANWDVHVRSERTDT